MPRAPRYIVFAGVNGAGKSTLYHSGMWVEESADLDLPRINSDEIIRELGWDWAKTSDQIAAGKLALARIEDLFSNRASFDQETTLAGRSIVRNITRAAEAGYEVEVHYVGVESVSIAISRIEHRVAVGGHDIDRASVERRYAASGRNLIEVFPSCKSVCFYDNSNTLSMVAYADQDTVIDFYPQNSTATWYQPILAQL